MNCSETNGAVDTAIDPPDDLMWTTREVADFLRVCPKTVFNLRKVGLPYVQLGGAVRFVPQRVKDYLAANPNLSLHRLRQIARKKTEVFMIAPRYLPPDNSSNDSALHLDQPTDDEILAIAIASEALHRIFDWIMQGDAQQRSLRFHLVVLCLFPQLLPCKRPSADWCAQIHGVSAQWARRLRRNFIDQFNGTLRFRAYHLSAK